MPAFASTANFSASRTSWQNQADRVTDVDCSGSGDAARHHATIRRPGDFVEVVDGCISDQLDHLRIGPCHVVDLPFHTASDNPFQPGRAAPTTLKFETGEILTTSPV